MKNARTPTARTLEEGEIPPEVHTELASSKARVRARIEEVSARIARKESTSQAEEAGEDSEVIATIE